MSIKLAASQISANIESHGNVGLDPATILAIVTTLLPMMAKCFHSETTASPRDYLQDHFDEDTQTFDQSLLNRMKPRTRRAARENGQHRLSRDQLDEISNHSLIHAMNADPSEVAACMSEAKTN